MLPNCLILGCVHMVDSQFGQDVYCVFLGEIGHIVVTCCREAEVAPHVCTKMRLGIDTLDRLNKRGDVVVPVGEPHHLGTGAYLASFSFMPSSKDAKAVSLDAVVQGAERRIARKHLSSRAELPVIVDVGGG